MLKNLNLFYSSFICFYLGFSALYVEIGCFSLSYYLDRCILLLMFISTLIIFIIIKKISDNNTRIVCVSITMFILIIFFFIFSASNIIIFYTFFEISVIPLIFLVSYWGYSLERVKALFYIFLYTFFFSFPFLLLIIFNVKIIPMDIFNINRNVGQTNILITVSIITILLVKIPIWGLHIWLIKAHVEASTEGSIVLARVVLKLAGIAIIKIGFFLNNYNYFLIISLFSSIRIVGALLLSFIIMRQRDLKLMVAVSSIIHISFILILYTTRRSFSIQTLVIIIVAHGLVSPLIFLFLGLVYDRLSSRATANVKGALKRMFYVRIIWFILCIFNIAVPLSINFVAEIFFFLSCMRYSLLIAILASLLIFLNGLFNLYLFISISRGENNIIYDQIWNNNMSFFNYIIIMVVVFYPIFLI